MRLFALVALGGAVGCMMRYGLTLATAKWSTTFPLGTALANGLGCLAIGALGYLAVDAQRISPAVAAALITGTLGGLTTFSSFALEVVILMRKGHPGIAVGYLTLSVVIGVGLTALSYFATRTLTG